MNSEVEEKSLTNEVEEKSLRKSGLPVAAETPAAGRDVNRDFPAAAEAPAAERDRDVNRDLKELAVGIKDSDVSSEDEQLAPLFSPDVAKDLRSRWDAVQSSFVDDPRQAVRQGDELVTQAMKSLTETFSNERARVEGQSDRTDKESTENLRIALRRYHSFFERLLAL